jgi:hypothetical protein
VNTGVGAGGVLCAGSGTGSAAAGGVGRAATTALGALTLPSDPAGFADPTRERNVEPTSAAAAVYVGWAALAIGLHVAPVASQRSQA